MIFVAFHSRKSKAEGQGPDDRHARYSDSEVGAFLSVDPLVSKQKNKFVFTEAQLSWTYSQSLRLGGLRRCALWYWQIYRS